MDERTAFLDLARRLAAPGTSGREDAAAELLARYSARLAALARSSLPALLAAKLDPEDVLQSVFRTFFRRLDAGEVELRDWGSLFGLLALTTARKCGRDRAWYAAAKRDVRRETNAPASFRDDPAWPPAADAEPTPAEAAAFADGLTRLLSGLDDREREAAELLLGGTSAAEAARRTGCTRRALLRLRTRLRQRLLAEYTADGRSPFAF